MNSHLGTSALRNSRDGIIDRVQSLISGVPRADGYQRVLWDVQRYVTVLVGWNTRFRRKGGMRLEPKAAP